MASDKVEVSGNETGTPVAVRQTGCLYLLGTFCAVMMLGALAGIVSELQTSNELKKKELDIQKERLDVAKRQYTLDSLKFYNSDKKR